MSKKCCGIIYNENEKFCPMCGKPLSEAEEVVDTNEETSDSEALPILDMEEIDKITAGILGEGDVSDNQKTEGTEEKENTEEVKTEEASQVPVSSDENKTSKNETEDEEDEDDDEEEDDGMASPALRFFGTLMIFVMIGSFVLVGLGVYFIMMKPFYRNHDVSTTIVYDNSADSNNAITATDAVNEGAGNALENTNGIRPLLTPVTFETEQTEAEVEDATQQDADISTEENTQEEEE